MITNFLIALGASFACTAAAVLFGEDVQMSGPQASLPPTSETVVIVGGKVSTPNPNGKAVVRAWAEMSVAAGTTEITLTVYSGPSIGGRVIGSKTVQASDFALSAKATFNIEFIDAFSNVSDVQYCLSVFQTGATDAGQILNALLDTKVLSG